MQSVTTLRAQGNVSIVTSPVGTGQRQDGVEWGANFLLRFTQLNQRLNLQPKIRRNREFSTVGLYEKTYRQVLGELARGRFTVTLGGDHSLSIASLAAALKIYPDLRVLWIDAHADINTPSSSPSGNLHGMPVAALLGLFDLSYRSEFSWLKPSLKAQQIAYLGVRDLDLGEKKTLSDLKIATYTSKDVQNLGIKSLFAKIKAELGIQADTPTYTSLDFDGLDPSQAPATGLRVPHGIKLSDFLKLIQLTKSQSHWIGSDLVEFNPFMARSQSEMLTTLSTAESFFDLLPWQANKLEPRLKILPSLLMKEELSNQSQVSFRRGWQTKFNSCMF